MGQTYPRCSQRLQYIMPIWSKCIETTNLWLCFYHLNSSSLKSLDLKALSFILCSWKSKSQIKYQMIPFKLSSTSTPVFAVATILGKACRSSSTGMFALFDPFCSHSLSFCWRLERTAGEAESREVVTNHINWSAAYLYIIWNSLVDESIRKL